MGGTRPRYARNSGVVFSLKYHVVWCPKYRRQVLVPPVDTRLKKIIGTVAAEYGFTVHDAQLCGRRCYGTILAKFATLTRSTRAPAVVDVVAN